MTLPLGDRVTPDVAVWAVPLAVALGIGLWLLAGGVLAATDRLLRRIKHGSWRSLW